MTGEMPFDRVAEVQTGEQSSPSLDPAVSRTSSYPSDPEGRPQAKIELNEPFKVQTHGIH